MSEDTPLSEDTGNDPSHLYSMAEKERKNVSEVRNHTDRVVSFLIRLLKRKKMLRFVPKAVRTQSIGFIRSACRFR